MNVNEAIRSAKRRQAYDLQVSDGKVDPTLVGPYMRQLGVPAKFCSEPLPDINLVKHAQVRRWLDQMDYEHPGLYLMSAERIGKTYAAAAIVRHCLEIGRTVAWVNWDDYLDIYTSKLNKSAVLDPEELSEEQAYLWHLRKVYNVVVIDGVDLGTNALFVVSQVSSLLHTRVDEGLYTVVTGRPPLHNAGEAPYEVESFMNMALSLFERVPARGGE